MTLWATPWIESRFGHLSPLTWTLIGAGGYVAVSFIIARLGALAIPALFLDDHSITDSLLISYRLTRCEWRILSVLLFKSIVGGYVAAMLPFWVARENPTDSQSALVVSMDTLCSFNCVRERGRTGHVHRLFLAVFEEDRSCKH